MQKLIILLVLFVTGCASTLGDKCSGWIFAEQRYEYEAGITKKVMTYKCWRFKSTPSH
jgi:hypothetical protein